MSTPTREIGPGLRLLGFVSVLFVVFGVGAGIGALAGNGIEPPPPAHSGPATSGHP